MRRKLGLVIGVLLCCYTYLVGQSSVQQSAQAAFDSAYIYLKTYQLIASERILTQLQDSLEHNQQLDSPFGLQVEMRVADLLEKKNENQEAVTLLLHVADRCAQKELWETYAFAKLSLARLHEKLSLWEACGDDLSKARWAIQSKDVSTAYPRFCVRMASFQRTHLNKRDSAIYFAREAVRTAPSEIHSEERSMGHYLLGMLYRGHNDALAINHFNTATRRLRKAGDDHHLAGGMANLTMIYTDKEDWKTALVYSDSSLAASHRALARGMPARWTEEASYNLRAKIYQELNQLDSVIHYQKLWFNMKMDRLRKHEKDKVMEVEARFADEKKARQIAEQEALLQIEKSWRIWLLLSAIIALLFLLIVAYYNFRLRQKNEETQGQAKIIHEKNDALEALLHQQTMLQGEVHHRVKNNLQVIISLLELQLDEIDDPRAQEGLDAMSNRIYSIAAIHELLYQREGAELVQFSDYVANICQHFSTLVPLGRIYFQLEIPEKAFNLETLMPLGIILTELITNSLKYANAQRDQLVIEIGLEGAAEETYRIKYQDNGQGFPGGDLPKGAGGLGSYLINRMSEQLGGHVTTYNDHGAVCIVTFKEKNILNSRVKQTHLNR